MIYTFFFPHIPPSGVSSLFARIAQAIAATKTAMVRVVDFRDGAMARLVPPGSVVEVVEFRRNIRIAIGPDETLVMQAELPGKFRRQLRLHPDARIIQWQLHPHNLVPPLFPLIGHCDVWLRRPGLYRTLLGLGLPRQKRNGIDFVTLAARKHSLFFQDLPALQATEKYLGLSVKDPILLPVPVSVPAKPVRSGRIALDELHVAWVGRFYDFKIHILVHTIRRFSAYARNTGKRVVFHIVGDGQLRSELVQFGEGANGLKLVRHGDLTAPELQKLLVERIDVVASMGTAALEGAAVGLPVILLDLAYATVPSDYQFRWLFEAKGFEIGHTITDADCCATADSFTDILAALETDYHGVAQKCFDYVMKAHALEGVTDRFLSLARVADLSYRDVPERLWQKTWIRRLYEKIRY